MKRNVIDTLEKAKRRKVQKEAEHLVSDHQKHKIDNQRVGSIQKSKDKAEHEFAFRRTASVSM